MLSDGEVGRGDTATGPRWLILMSFTGRSSLYELGTAMFYIAEEEKNTPDCTPLPLDAHFVLFFMRR